MLSPVSRHSDSSARPFIWPVFADVMAGLAGLFVLLFVWAVVFQLDLTSALTREREALAREQKARALEQQRLAKLEASLATPLAEGRITLKGDRIAISGSVLFALNSADLEPAGRALLKELTEPLRDYTGATKTAIMVSGFTDDLRMTSQDGTYRDNWELSTERALTVTRALIALGFPSDRLFAAGFGPHHPVVPNDSDDARAKNRRVEIAPVPFAVATAASAPIVAPAPVAPVPSAEGAR